MKTRLFALTGLTMVLGLGAAFGVSAQTPSASVLAVTMQRREKHPELIAALRALRNAKARLQAASRDFDGHRIRQALSPHPSPLTNSLASSQGEGAICSLPYH